MAAYLVAIGRIDDQERFVLVAGDPGAACRRRVVDSGTRRASKRHDPRQCKHAMVTGLLAQRLYGVGARLDHAPELLFALRGVDPVEMVEAAVDQLAPQLDGFKHPAPATSPQSKEAGNWHSRHDRARKVMVAR